MSAREPRRGPDRELERLELERHLLVGGMDEVGRGSLAGPVTVGLAVVSRDTPQALPAGLADSKQLSARRREALVEPCRQWVADWAVASSTPAEIDALGIVGALRLAGLRALAEVAARAHAPGLVILDGTHDWLTPPQADLLSVLPAGQAPSSRPDLAADTGAGAPDVRVPAVRTLVKADARCAVVAAASVLAKVHRDGLMSDLEDPGYDWAANKGYASAAHVAGLTRLGASVQHRRSWRLPGLGASAPEG